MQRFKIQSENLALEVLLDCIIEKSAFAVKDSPQYYYTFEDRPTDWTNTFVADIRRADRIRYRDRVFYGVKPKNGGRYVWFLYQGMIYYFDSYYSNCPILESILASSRYD